MAFVTTVRRSSLPARRPSTLPDLADPGMYGLLDPAPAWGPARNTALYLDALAWIRRTRDHGPDQDGPLAGITWMQRAWYWVHETGEQTCCVAGAIVRLSGGVFTSPLGRGVVPGAMYSGCHMPGRPGVEPVPEAAGSLLGLGRLERMQVFEPGRTLPELEALTGLLASGERLTAAAVTACIRDAAGAAA